MDSPDAGPSRRPGEWVTHATLRDVYSSWWMTLRIDDVERPDGSHTEHEIVIGPNAAGVVVRHPERGVLMIWRHRFMAGVWGWEIPGGALDPGEDAATAAERECVEETGWRPVGPLHHLTTFHPSIGFTTQVFHIFLATDAVHEGDPADRNEAVRVAWRPISDVAREVVGGEIADGFTQLGLALALSENVERSTGQG